MFRSRRRWSVAALLIGSALTLSTVGQAKTTIKFIGNWYNVADQVNIFKSWVKDLTNHKMTSK